MRKKELKNCQYEDWLKGVNERSGDKLGGNRSLAQRGDSGESKTKTVLREGEMEMHKEGIEQIMNTEKGESKKEGLRAGEGDQLQIADQDITSQDHTSSVPANTEIVAVVGNVINEMKTSEVGELYRLIEIEWQDLGQENILRSDFLRLIEIPVRIDFYYQISQIRSTLKAKQSREREKEVEENSNYKR